MALAEQQTPTATVSDQGQDQVTMVPRARTRVAPARIAPKKRGWVGTIVAGNKVTGRDKPVWRERPVSLADVVAYTREGGWVPGDWPWWVELPGKAYGWLVAIPTTAVTHVALWTIQRPSRLFGAVILTAVLWRAA